MSGGSQDKPPRSLGFEEGPTRFASASQNARVWTEGWARRWLYCPNCGNDRNFQVKTLQMHVVNLENGRVEVSEEDRPTVLEVLCDECETALKFEEFEDTLRKEVLLTIGAR